jgi:hypothetical protein
VIIKENADWFAIDGFGDSHSGDLSGELGPGYRRTGFSISRRGVEEANLDQENHGPLGTAWILDIFTGAGFVNGKFPERHGHVRILPIFYELRMSLKM